MKRLRYILYPFSFFIYQRLFITSICVFFNTISTYADHIVGGNIEMIALDKTPGRYKVVMKIYYDRLKISSNFPTLPNNGKRNHSTADRRR